MTIDVGLDPITGDLPAFTRHIRAEELAIQRVKTRLLTFLGEWILDTTKGLDYVGFKRQKPPNDAAIGAIIQAEIESTPGVDRVDDFESAFDPKSGVDATLTFTGRIIFDPGDASEVTIVASVLASGGNTTPAVILFGSIVGITGPSAGGI